MLIYVYKIVTNLDDNLVYIGSTKRSLNRRFSAHKLCSDKGINSLLYRTMRMYGNHHFKIELIDTRECNDFADQLNFERECYDANTHTLNSKRPGITYQEKLDHVHDHYRENKAAINTRRSQKHECECKGKYTTWHRSHHEQTERHKAFLNHA